MAKAKRARGSEKVWLDEKNNLFWLSVVVHEGRTSRQFNGPRAASIKEAREALNESYRLSISEPVVV